MKLYFVECPDECLEKYRKTIDVLFMNLIYRGAGFHSNQKHLSNIKDGIILSNDESILCRPDKFFNDELNKWEIYLWKNNKWIEIQETTDKELRKAHNIEYIYRANGFDCDIKNSK